MRLWAINLYEYTHSIAEGQWKVVSSIYEQMCNFSLLAVVHKLSRIDTLSTFIGLAILHSYCIHVPPPDKELVYMSHVALTNCFHRLINHSNALP